MNFIKQYAFTNSLVQIWLGDVLGDARFRRIEQDTERSLFATRRRPGRIRGSSAGRICSFARFDFPAFLFRKFLQRFCSVAPKDYFSVCLHVAGIFESTVVVWPGNNRSPSEIIVNSEERRLAGERSGYFSNLDVFNGNVASLRQYPSKFAPLEFEEWRINETVEYVRARPPAASENDGFCSAEIVSYLLRVIQVEHLHKQFPVLEDAHHLRVQQLLVVVNSWRGPPVLLP